MPLCRSSVPRATTLCDAVGGRRPRLAGGGVPGAHRAPGRAGAPPGVAGPPAGPPAALQAPARRPGGPLPPAPPPASQPGAGALPLHPVRGRRLCRHEDKVSGRGLAVEQQAAAVLREHELRTRRRREGIRGRLPGVRALGLAGGVVTAVGHDCLRTIALFVNGIERDSRRRERLA